MTAETRYSTLRQDIALAHQAWQHGDFSLLLRVLLHVVDALEALDNEVDAEGAARRHDSAAQPNGHSA